MKLLAKICLIVFLLIACLLVIREVRKPSPLSDAVYHDFDEIEFPYVADKNRIERIRANSHKLKQGLLDTEVNALLGKPDQAGRVYSAQLRGKEVGKAYVYVLSKDKKQGSYLEKNAVELVIYFNNENRVIKAYGDRIDFFNDFGLKK